MIKQELKKPLSYMSRELERFIEYTSSISEELYEKYLKKLGLDSILQEMNTDLEELKKYNKETYNFIASGNVIGFTSGDGVSFHQVEYYEIVKVNEETENITANVLTVVFGDYTNSIGYESDVIISLTDFIGMLDKKIHSTNTKENRPKFEEYKKFISGLHEL
jgi:hypothetical protein